MYIQETVNESLIKINPRGEYRETELNLNLKRIIIRWWSYKPTAKELHQNAMMQLGFAVIFLLLIFAIGLQKASMFLSLPIGIIVFSFFACGAMIDEYDSNIKKERE